ncbi:MAG: aminopeptidase [Cyclobacteriaceae bacterium]
MIKKVLWVVLLIIIAFLSYHWELVNYGILQTKGQINVIVNARPIDEFINDPDFPDSLKQKLLLTKEVRRFAIDSLGLKNSENYTKLFDQQGKTLLWNVSASERFELKPYKWEFPFLGAMPYKGYFDLDKAKEEANRLEALGLDTRVRRVGGWSTLGILEDPLLSNMLGRNDGALAEVIIHELTHATLFVVGEVAFNENLASFIGERGSEQFLISVFGDSSAQHLEYLQSEADSRLLTKIVLHGAEQLDSLYGTFNDEPIEFKDSLKQYQIQQVVNDLKKGEFYNERYRNIFDKRLPNNAYFMAQRRYHSQEDSIQSILDNYGGDIRVMLKGLKEQYGH